MPFSGSQTVNVQAGFSLRMPLASDDEKTLLESQRFGWPTVYEMASKECALLKATIAGICRLTNLNVSTQVRQSGRNMPAMLMLNGNARFTITLKGEESK